MNNEEEKEFLAWLTVTPETHTELTCTCPECGAVFKRWFQNSLVENPLDREMEEQTTDCEACIDELLSEQEWEEEMAELREQEEENMDVTGWLLHSRPKTTKDKGGE